MLYAGETVRIKTSVLDPDGNYLVVSVDTTATVEFFDEEGEQVEFLDSNDDPVAQPVAMTGDSSVEPNVWVYDWTTNGVDPGVYYAKVVITGLTYSTWDYKKITLRGAPYSDNSNC